MADDGPGPPGAPAGGGGDGQVPAAALSVGARPFVPASGGGERNAPPPAGDGAPPLAASPLGSPPPGFDVRPPPGLGFRGQARVGVQDDGVKVARRSPDGDDASTPSPPPPLCSVCTDPIHAVALTPCNHKAVCALCALRLRLCYGDDKCPLCKAPAAEVVICWWSPRVPDWGAFAARLGSLSSKPGWARGVFVDDGAPRGAPRPPRAHPLAAAAPRLSAALHALTGRTCPGCPPDRARPMPSVKALLGHVRSAHGGGSLCSLCLDEGRGFVRDLAIYPTPASLRTHIDATHPPCTFCEGRRFFDADALFEHTRAAHFTCHVCHREAGAYHHEASASALVSHMRQAHFLCGEPACEGAFAAFASRDGLEAHARTVHGRSMPRFDRRAARLLPLEINVRRGGGGGGVAAPARAPPRAARAPALRPAARPAPTNSGVRVIDDDEAAFGGRSGGRGGRDDYPALAPAATPTPAIGAPPPLIRVTTRCPCGKRRSHAAVVAGTVVPALACDAGCAAGARAATLATAFGVDRDLHVPVFERAAAPDYDATMLAYAWHNRDEVAGLEGMLADFVADRAAARRSVPPAPDAARKLLHQLAPFYGLASQSFGTGARRHVELFKAGASRAVVPAVPLSTTANRLTREDVEAATRSAAGYPLVLADVAPGADLDTLLQRFRGQCALEGPWDDGAAVARFRAAASLRSALDTLGGGMRGAFRVDRPGTALANEGNGALESGRGGRVPPPARTSPPPPPRRPARGGAGVDPFDAVPVADWGRAGGGGFDWADDDNRG